MISDNQKFNKTGGNTMYQYKYYGMNITIILGYVTRVAYNKGADTFYVNLTGEGEPREIPNKFYDDFMNKLSSYVKSQG